MNYSTAAKLPTPILKSKRKRRSQIDPPKPSVGFSREVATVIEKQRPSYPKSNNERVGVLNKNQSREESMEEESDTDVGEEDEGGEFSFDSDDARVAAEVFGADVIEHEMCTTANGTTNNINNTPPSISRMGAKVRRLNLDDSDSGGRGGGGQMDVKKSLALSSATNGNWYGGDESEEEGGGSPLHNMYNRKLLPPGPTLKGGPLLKDDEMLVVCPPAAAKGGSRRGLFASGKNNEDEDDVSPRDVVDFPFFAANSPPSNKMKGLPANKMSLFDKMNGKTDNNIDVADKATIGGATANNLPPCPPSAIKKKRLGLGGLQAAAAAGSPPRGLRSVGRANSFLEMFSRDVVAEGGLGDIPEASFEDDDKDTDDDDGEDSKDDDSGMDEMDGFAIRRLARHDTCESFKMNSAAMDDNVEYAISSPRKRRGAPRFTPSSPSKTDRGANPSSPTGKTSPVPFSSSSFSRFVNDFEIVGTLGNGSFGSVYKVRNRTDQRLYAIKAAKREARGKSDRERMMREVYALAELSESEEIQEAMHIVRYHQAWMEGNRLYIQTELCDMTLLREMQSPSSALLTCEKRRYKLLREMSLALDLVHKSGMIHLDIKPENIFVNQSRDGNNDRYKLGDFGLVSKIEDHGDVEEGDSRYMSLELLSGELDDLTKSDIFSLGATMYEICLGRSHPLPENGPEWQDIRRGMLLPMPNTGFDMSMIVKEMLAPDRHDRPSAEELLKKRQLLSDEQRQLIVERNKANAANMALDAQMQRFKLLSPNNHGRKFNRSNTIC